jgi:hypothetical protein
MIDEVEFLRRQLQIDKEKMHLLEETMENLKNQGLINAGKHLTLQYFLFQSIFRLWNNNDSTG